MVSIKTFLIGLAFLALGILLIVKNKKISKTYQNTASKITKINALNSKGMGTYLRVRYYISGIALTIIGAILIVVSIII